MHFFTLLRVLLARKFLLIATPAKPKFSAWISSWILADPLMRPWIWDKSPVDLFKAWAGSLQRNYFIKMGFCCLMLPAPTRFQVFKIHPVNSMFVFLITTKIDPTCAAPKLLGNHRSFFVSVFGRRSMMP